MFVVHDLTDNSPTMRDFGHVNQFFRTYPLYRQNKNETIFQECVKQGFIYTQEYIVETRCGRKSMITYHRSLKELQDEVQYNRNINRGR